MSRPPRLKRCAGRHRERLEVLAIEVSSATDAAHRREGSDRQSTYEVRRGGWKIAAAVRIGRASWSSFGHGDAGVISVRGSSGMNAHWADRGIAIDAGVGGIPERPEHEGPLQPPGRSPRPRVRIGRLAGPGTESQSDRRVGFPDRRSLPPLSRHDRNIPPGPGTARTTSRPGARKPLRRGVIASSPLRRPLSRGTLFIPRGRR